MVRYTSKILTIQVECVWAFWDIISKTVKNDNNLHTDKGIKFNPHLTPT